MSLVECQQVILYSFIRTLVFDFLLGPWPPSNVWYGLHFMEQVLIEIRYQLLIFVVQTLTSAVALQHQFLQNILQFWNQPGFLGFSHVKSLASNLIICNPFPDQETSFGDTVFTWGSVFSVSCDSSQITIAYVYIRGNICCIRIAISFHCRSLYSVFHTSLLLPFHLSPPFYPAHVSIYNNPVFHFQGAPQCLLVIDLYLTLRATWIVACLPKT